MKWKVKRAAGLMPKWLLSYLLVFLIPMAAGLLVYTSAERIIREDIKNVSGYVLAQIQLSFDNITSEVYALSRQIALDTEINALMEKEKLTPEDRLLVMDAVSKCAAYKASATSVDDYYIYLKNSGCMLKYSGFIERDGVRDVIPNTEKFGGETWNAIVRGEKNNRIIPYAYIDSGAELKEAVSYVIPIPLYAAEPKGFVVAHIDKERYQDIAIRVYQNSDFAVLDGDGTLIFSTMDGQREEELLSSLPDAAHETVEYGGGRYYIKETYSGVNSLRYISVTARDAAYQKLSHIRRMMLLAFGLCVLTGVLCAMYFSRKNYRPIKSVLNLLVKQKLLKTGGDAEEGQLLIDAISQLVTSKNKMDQKLHQQRDYVRTSVLSKLINNGFSDALSAKRLENMCDLDLSRPCFAVLGFHIYEQDSGQTDVQEYEFRFLIVKNVFEELLNQRYTAYIAEINSVICGIVNFDPQEETAYRKDLRTIVECGQAAVLNNFGIELAIASSVVRRELASVPQCYSEAVTGIQNLVFQQSKDLLFYDSLLTENQSGYEYYFSFNREQRLIDCVKAGDAAGAKAMIGEMFEKYNDHSVASVNVIKCVISDVAAAIFKAACQVQGGAGGGVPPEISNPQNLDAASLKKEFFSYVDAVCAGVAASASEKENSIVSSMKELVAMEYNNMSLNISHIADVLGLNATYISRVFLANTGEGLLNYINRYRVEKAKALLANPSLTVESVGAMVGFGSSNSFIRVFRKYEYMTPGQYQQMERDKAHNV